MSATRDTIRILHVDDEPNLAASTADFLNGENDRFSVKTATSARAALEFLSHTKFDCVISDYEIPGQNGIEFLETVRGKYPSLPFILYTGNGSEDLASEAISSGVTDYLQKGSETEQNLITVENSIPDVKVFADEMLESVFRNLLKNVIQHNDKDVPEVSASATRTDTTVSIRMADNGPGVANSQKNTIFRQGEKGLESEGTGLGLYLVDTLVERYDGDVHIEDNEPEGAVFIVEIPVVE